MTTEEFCKYLLENYPGYRVRLRCGNFAPHDANENLIDNSCVWANEQLVF